MAILLKKTLIGAMATVADAKNQSLKGLSGIIIDETKYTISIKTKKGVKRIIKESIVLELPAERARVKGSLLVGRPEERIKRK